MKKQPTLKLLESLMQTVKDHRTLTYIHQRDNDTYQKLFKLWWKFNSDNQDELMSMGFVDFDEEYPQMYELGTDFELHHSDISHDHWNYIMELHFNELSKFTTMLSLKETISFN